ncbi:MAG TPA: VanZ family protein [Terriglobales bacterium]|nr:VanZ family protein [Terriglobales bacterium]
MWLSLIVIESSNAFSSENTGGMLYPILHFLTGVDPVRFEVWHHYIRKTGHFVGFFTLSWLLFRSWRATLPAIDLRAWTFQWATIAWLMATFVASMDEWHQSFLPSRTGTFHDVVLDSSAALISQIVVWWFLRNRPWLTVRNAY